MPVMKWNALPVLLTVIALLAAQAIHAAPDAVPAAPLGADGARHLLNRTGFAATAAEIEAFAPLTREAAVDRLLREATEIAVTPPPAWTNAPIVPPAKLREMSDAEREAERRLNVERAFDLREWWFKEMLATPSPLGERMTLFWHNHFATSQQKVRYTVLMYRQNAVLRRHALGNFRTMLHEIGRDPAMLIYLDGATSRREQPNENFAREVMELFTLGEGHYTERDIKEAARAFTGWSVDRETGEFLFRRGAHDGGVKSLFGRRGNFGGDEVLDILLAQPAAATYIAGKLWREFVSPTPDMAEIDRLARVFRDSGYNIAKLMRALLLTETFHSPENRGTLVKSPVEYVVGTLRLFDIKPTNLRPYVLAAALLGQNVFSPPNVKGWPGGESWINSATLLGRKQFVDRLLRTDDRMEATMRALDEMADRNGDPAPPGRAQRQQRSVERAMMLSKWTADEWAENFARQRGADAARDMTRTLLALAPQKTIPADTPAGERLRALLSDPVFQLK